ncbi:MAG: sigma-70 family RNA polymerase sigma factor [Verrucomicrobia bacterium]|nr:sigma-70 family RNA polymerase sigma factor [Verrucomicrobiota bacterium]
MSEITLLLEAVERGENQAAEELLPLVYDELRHLAAARLGHNSTSQTLQATALVHEAWLRLINQGDRTWNNREHFFRAAAQAMRHILVDLSRQKASLKRGSHPERLNIEEMDLAVAAPDDRILLVNHALARLEEEDPDSAQLVILKFFGGFTNQEVAHMLGLSERTLARQWAYAKGCLYQLIQEESSGNPPSA